LNSKRGMRPIESWPRQEERAGQARGKHTARRGFALVVLVEESPRHANLIAGRQSVAKANEERACVWREKKKKKTGKSKR